jgi:hypothetical protein
MNKEKIEEKIEEDFETKIKNKNILKVSDKEDEFKEVEVSVLGKNNFDKLYLGKKQQIMLNKGKLVYSKIVDFEIVASDVEYDVEKENKFLSLETYIKIG